MHGARATFRRRRGFSSRESFSTQARRLGRVTAEGDPCGAGKDEREEVRIAERFGRRACLRKSFIGQLVATRPEDEVSMVVERAGSAGSASRRLGERPFEPAVAV